jgi:hypothetical protein
MSNINTLAGYINNHPELTREFLSLSEQVFYKLVRYEGIRIKRGKIVVETNLEYGIKALILNIILSAKSNYTKENPNFYITEDEENQLIELMYYMITRALTLKVNINT